MKIEIIEINMNKFPPARIKKIIKSIPSMITDINSEHQWKRYLKKQYKKGLFQNRTFVICVGDHNGRFRNIFGKKHKVII